MSHKRPHLSVSSQKGSMAELWADARGKREQDR